MLFNVCVELLCIKGVSLLLLSKSSSKGTGSLIPVFCIRATITASVKLKESYFEKTRQALSNNRSDVSVTEISRSLNSLLPHAVANFLPAFFLTNVMNSVVGQ